MEKKDVLTALEDIFLIFFKREGITLDYDTTANDVDGWDSITNMTIINEVEKYYGIHLKMREIIKMKNVGGLCEAIINK